MPYNTRRKSLSLPSLGIHVPGSHAHRSPATASSNRNISDYTPSRITIIPTVTLQSNKRQKRFHGDETRRRGNSVKRPDEKSMLEHTPPPSPTAENIKIGDCGNTTLSTDTKLEGINDEIVEAVIVQLQATANRPHLVKELATVLSQQLPIVQQRALPDPTTPLLVQRSVISPSLSSVASGSEDGDDMELRRRELSPSPEVDLSSPEFDDADDDFAMPSTPVGSLPTSLRYARSHRSASPPLEKDEREFTQTADVLQKRKLARELSTATADHSTANTYEGSREDAMFEERQSVAVNGNVAPVHFLTSPAIKATMPPKKDTDGDSWLKLGALLEWDHSPENIELDELDCLLDSC
ncbi:mucin [Colletotrichum camelliae]|nr:mucin [Colletotrichum camelliae]